MSEQKTTILTDAEPLPGASQQSERPSALKRILGGSVGRNLGLVIALLVLIIIGTVTAGDRFADINNVLTIIRYASIVGVISVGMTFVITAGGIDLSVGSVMGLATVVASLSAVQLASPQFSGLLMMLIALLVGAAAGFVNGMIIAYGRVVAFMATLAMLVGARGFAELISGRRTQIVSNNEFLDIVRANVLGVPVLIFATLINVFTQNNLDTSTQAIAKGVIIVVAVLLQQRFATRGPSSGRK